MNARKRTTGRERIPKHLYVEKRKRPNKVSLYSYRWYQNANAS